MTVSPPTFCVGVEVTWWGGSPGKRKTQLETIVSASLYDPGSFAMQTVEANTNGRYGELTASRTAASRPISVSLSPTTFPQRSAKLVLLHLRLAEHEAGPRRNAPLSPRRDKP